MWTIGAGWAWLVMTLATVAVWALVILGIGSIFRSLTESREPGQEGGRESDSILDEEFARGRIDAEEYRARHQVLHTPHPSRRR